MEDKTSDILFMRILIGCVITAAVCAFVIGCGGPKKEISALPEEELDITAADTSIIKDGVERDINVGQVTALIGEPIQLTSGDFHNGIGSFHPNGSRIVYQSNRDGRWQVYELNLADNSERKLVVSDANDENPVWTPDGRLVLFVSDRAGKGVEWERDIYSYDPAADATLTLTDTPADDWYPIPVDGESFIFLTEREADADLPVYYKQNSMYIGFLDGSDAVKIAGADLDPTSPVQWKNDIFIVRLHSGRLAAWSSVYGSSELLTPENIKCGSSAVNKERDWLVFCGREEDTPYKLYLLDLSSDILQPLDPAEGEVRYPQFSPDGRSIIYTAEKDGHFQLFRLQLGR